MKNFKILVSALVLVLVLTGCTLLYPNWGKPTDSPKPSDSKTSTPTDSPTDSQTPDPTDTNKGVATIEIMDSYVDNANGVLSVIARVTNFSEDGGTCTLTFKSGTKTQSVTVNSESNAANTQCRAMEIPLSKLPVGAGSITVTYDSAKNHGISDSTPVTIQ
jgi:PBP1b-binding outer membrane lipoprotein LpoB